MAREVSAHGRVWRDTPYWSATLVTRGECGAEVTLKALAWRGRVPHVLHSERVSVIRTDAGPVTAMEAAELIQSALRELA